MPNVIKIGEPEEHSFYPEVLYSFNVFNDSDVPGIVMTTDLQYWTIPPHEGREIRARELKDPPFRTNRYYLNRPFSQNFPSYMYLELEDNIIEDTTSKITHIDSITFWKQRNVNEIIVDNEDPGSGLSKQKVLNSCLYLEKRITINHIAQTIYDKKHGLP